MPKKKSAKANADGVKSLAADKPVVYRHKNKSGGTEYIGSATRGRVTDRLTEHLPSGKDPVRGASKVEITQYDSIAKARAAEARAIKREQPKQNKKGK